MLDEQLRGSAGGSELAEMAGEISPAGSPLRDVAHSCAYVGPLTKAIDGFHAAQAELSEEETREAPFWNREPARDDEVQGGRRQT